MSASLARQGVPTTIEVALFAQGMLAAFPMTFQTSA